MDNWHYAHRAVRQSQGDEKPAFSHSYKSLGYFSKYRRSTSSCAAAIVGVTARGSRTFHVKTGVLSAAAHNKLI
jgi:hypothetical protein